MIRYRLAMVVVLLVVGSGSGSRCGVGVDAAPRPLEPITTVPLQPAPTVVERPDDQPAPARDVSPSTPPTTTESC